MTPIQQLMLGVGAKKKTYLDDVFSTYLHAGNETAKSIVNGVDLTKGGLVWTKNRSHTGHNYFFDTERGATKYIKSNQTNAEGYDNNTLTSFNNNGFSLGVDTSQNENGRTFSTWSFRKAEGFFDVVTYTGNGSNRTIAHSLGSVPGMIMVKCTSESRDWAIYHRNLEGTSGNEDNAGTAIIFLNTTEGGSHNDEYWNDTAPTSTHFSVGTQNGTNKNGATYVAYVFAGGESTAAEATSVDFDGSNDKMTLSATSGDLAFGTGDFTWECWVKSDAISSTWKTLFQSSTAADNNTFYLSIDSNSVNVGNQSVFIIQASHTFVAGQWYHIAACRASGTLRMFVNGTEAGSVSDSTNWSASTGVAYIGANDLGNGSWADGHNGKISNMRIVKGTALYTSSFRPPTEPLKNVTNTKLLCLQGSSATSATVIPSGSITNDGATHSSDSPFNDPAAFKFGDNKEGIIKCGSYIGNGSSTGPEIYLGWEPQWLLIKGADTSSGSSWFMYDAMRGLTGTGSNYAQLTAQSSAEEYTDSYLRVSINSTGFQVQNSGAWINENTKNFVFVAIRRPDGYVGKPAEAGTDVFAMDTGNSSSTIPAMDSNFPVDFALVTQPASTADKWAYGRLMQGRYLRANTTNAGDVSSAGLFDSNVGFYAGSNYNSNYQSWMWKRHAGFDVVTYVGNDGTGQSSQAVPHSLSKTPEMIWVKCRSAAKDWKVYHKGLNGGTNPEQYHLVLNSAAAEVDSVNIWNDIAPTSTHFTLFNNGDVNDTGEDYIAMLFASVDGISKVGSYTGQSSGDLTIDLGFTPRLFICKRIDGASGDGHWNVFDTVRGIVSGNDSLLNLNRTNAQSSYDYIDPATNGITLRGGIDLGILGNSTDHKHLYYAHA